MPLTHKTEKKFSYADYLTSHPATALKDKREKKNLYEKYGVKEYIIIDPLLLYVERFLLEEGGLYGKADIFGPKEVLLSVVLEDIQIPLWEVFEVEEPKRNKGFTESNKC